MAYPSKSVFKDAHITDTPTIAAPPDANSVSKRRSFWRRLWGAVWRTAAAFALLAVVAEIVLRLCGFGSRVQYDSSVAVLWAPRPRQHVPNNLTRAPVAIDHRGLRHVPRAGDESENRCQVLCLGDSVTFGFALSDDETYESVLQAELEDAQPGRWHLMNAGVNGYNLYLVRQRLLALLESGVKPDLVLLGYCFNEYQGWPNEDFSQTEREAIVKGVRNKNLLRSIGLFNFATEIVSSSFFYRLRNRLMPRGGTSNPKASVPSDEWLEQYRRRVRALFAELNQRGIPFMVVIWPDKSGALGNFRGVMIEECAALHIPYANLGHLVKDRDTSDMFFDFEHPKPNTMAMLVKEGVTPFFRAHAPQLVRPRSP